jgi:hypothetical protein
VKNKNNLKASEIFRHSPPREQNLISAFGRPAAANPYIWQRDNFYPRHFRINLYRFLRDNIPLLNSCIWTWSRLSSAPGKYEIAECRPESQVSEALQRLDEMQLRLYPFKYHKMGGLESFLPLLLDTLYTDGAFAGFLILDSDLSGIERFQPVDTASLTLTEDASGKEHIALETDHGSLKIDGEDFYYLGLNADVRCGLGRSILSAIPFVAYIEQQLIEDMRKTTHNAGYYRLHVHLTPPEKLTGESDETYVQRANQYFDETVSMIRGCGPEDNPVTWDNVKVEYIGPRTVQGVTGAWFLSHRAVVEEICAGTNLAPFMLGYSYGTTHNWAQFKYDLVMRQVLSVQRQVGRFLEWLGNIELALRGLDCRCRYTFDNSLTYLAPDRVAIQKSAVDNLIRLFSAGLISRETALQKAGDLL